MTGDERDRDDAALRARSRAVVARLLDLADQLDDLGSDLRAEVDRRRTERGTDE